MSPYPETRTTTTQTKLVRGYVTSAPYFRQSSNPGIAWVTFDSTSGSSGLATPRIFVGVANAGSDNVFVSSDAGSTCEYLRPLELPTG